MLERWFDRLCQPIDEFCSMQRERITPAMKLRSAIGVATLTMVGIGLVLGLGLGSIPRGTEIQAATAGIGIILGLVALLGWLLPDAIVTAIRYIGRFVIGVGVFTVFSCFVAAVGVGFRSLL